MSVLVRKTRTTLRLLASGLRRRALLRIPWAGGGKPRVMFLSDSDGAPFRYRVLNQIEQLHAAGAEAACCDPRHLGLARLLRSCDLLVLYRLDDTPHMQRIVAAARRRGVPVVCDTDDLTWDERAAGSSLHDYDPPQAARLRARFAGERALLQRADAFVASTEYLAGLLRADFGRPAFVNQNAVSRAAVAQSGALFERRQAHPSAGPLTIAYFSGWPNTHEADLATALPGILRALAELPGARLRIVGHFDSRSLPEPLRARVEIAAFVPYERLLGAIAAADINLAPIVDNPHRRSKSAVKFLEAALVGVPTVAADLEPYHLIRHGETGMLAADTEGWYAGIMALAADAGLRRSIGAAARTQVLAEHTTDVRAPAFAALLREIVGSPRAER